MVLAECLLQASIVSQLAIAPDASFWTTPPAYLDPGTGSLIIQMLIGALVGGAVAAKVFWKRGAQRLKGLLNGGSKNDEDHN